jgi:hypothetical protein
VPIHDIDAQDKSLDDDYGASHGSNAPASHDLALFFSDPLLASDPTTVELDSTNSPGYARVTINNDATWAAASGGQKLLAAGYVTMPDPTDTWLQTATHWGLLGSDGKWWDCGELQAPLIVSSAGSGPVVSPAIFYGNYLTPA